MHADDIELERDVTIPETEFADDGSPLGTLMVAGKVYERKSPVVKLGETAEIELVKSKSVDLTGSDDADRELIALYDEYDNQEKRRLALERYVKDGLTASQVALELHVPERTVLMWAYHGKWNKAASRTLAVKMEEEARALTRLRLKHREDLLRKQIEDSRELQERLMKDVKSGDTHVTKSTAEALAALAKVQNAAMGVADSGNIVTGVGDEGENTKSDRQGEKVPLVVVVNNGSSSGIPTLVKRKDVVDV